MQLPKELLRLRKVKIMWNIFVNYSKWSSIKTTAFRYLYQQSFFKKKFKKQIISNCIENDNVKVSKAEQKNG